MLSSPGCAVPPSSHLEKGSCSTEPGPFHAPPAPVSSFPLLLLLDCATTGKTRFLHGQR